MKHFKKLINVDKEKRLFTAEGGIMISELNELLRDRGYALSVLGSISELTLAGVICTGTHGTGIQFGNLASSVTEIELMTSDGEIRTLSKEADGDVFRAAAVSLGCLGVILKVTAKCEEAFNLKQNSYGANIKDLLENLDVHLKASDHFRFMWYPHTDQCVTFHTRRTQEAVRRSHSWFWDYLIGFYLLEFLLWISTWFKGFVPLINRTYSRINSKPSEFIDVSYKVFNFNCLFRQYVMEWAIPIEKTQLALFELKNWIGNSGFEAHSPVEVRFVRGDDMLLSPANGRDVCYVNIIMYRPYNKLVAHAEYWEAFKQIMLRNDGRPHWAKDHLMTAKELRPLYPKWDTFCRIRQKMDPKGMFMNENLKNTLSYS
ncbi:hypothetical protein CAPTEDRAFT_161254 [Capitella teleta]|uniref:FAD-binding PCMH-type domain-containing protein n=1 Tax=Capitella teleta TaxID=283909 RepID=R7TXP4_CAPTE|nr:hypothetical protein CAPTEDRAFT_161254 [Capitella teleta]|eukprot:ELT96216.1 hypothetical protein CAPTEDRAFT_161254 [Capitella teleta]